MKQLTELTTVQLTALYNEFVENMLADNDPVKPVKKFKTQAAAIARIENLMLERGLTFNQAGDKLCHAEIPMSKNAMKAAAEKAPKKAKAERTPRTAMAHDVNDSINHTLRAGSNQAILAEAMVNGVTLRTATDLLNDVRASKNPGAAPLSKSVISGTMSYDLVKLKGYGIRSEEWNGEKLYENGFKADAEELGYGTAEPKDLTKTVYFLVMPKGMKTPDIQESPSRAAKAPKEKANGASHEAAPEAATEGAPADPEAESVLTETGAPATPAE